MIKYKLQLINIINQSIKALHTLIIINTKLISVDTCIHLLDLHACASEYVI